MRFMNNTLGYILVACLFLFAITEVRGEEEEDPIGDESGDGSGDGSGVDPEGSGKEDPCDGYVCENETDVCKPKNVCVGEECQDVPVCEAKDESQDQIVTVRRCTKKHEVFLFCGKKCESTCDKQNRKCRGCAWFKCQCATEYVREKGECIRLWQCPKKCGKNEELKRCATSCEATCRNQNPDFCFPCQPNTCQCKDGFVRSRAGNCILKTFCRRG